VRSDEKEIFTMKNCGRCHTCGEELVQVLDGEVWCSNCQTYRRYRSHGWGEAGEADAGFECPEQIQPLKPSEPDYGRWLEELMGIEWCRQAFPEGYYDDVPRQRDDVAAPQLPKPLAIRACHDGPLPAATPTCPTCGRVIGTIGVIRANVPVPPVGKNPTRQRARLTRCLRRLRLDIEREMAEDGLEPCLADAQAAMLVDVCRALGLKDTETRYVLGPAGRALLEDREWISR
jgi:hypothetical protein